MEEGLVEGLAACAALSIQMQSYQLVTQPDGDHLHDVEF